MTDEEINIFIEKIMEIHGIKLYTFQKVLIKGLLKLNGKLSILFMPKTNYIHCGGVDDLPSVTTISSRGRGPTIVYMDDFGDTMAKLGENLSNLSKSITSVCNAAEVFTEFAFPKAKDVRFLSAEPRYISRRTATYVNTRIYRCPLPHQFHIY